MPVFNYGAGFRSNPMDAYNEMVGVRQAAADRLKQSKLADLLANAYGAQDQAQRQGYIADAIRTDPAQGMTLAKLLQPTSQESFTLGPGSKRFGPDGRVIAEVPFAPASARLVSVPDGQGGARQMLFDPRTQEFMQPNYGGESPQGQWAQPGASYQTPSGIVRIDPSIDPADLGVVQADIANNAQANNYKLPDQIVGSPQGQMGYTPPKTEAPKFASRQYTPQEVQQMGLPAGTVAYTSENGTPKIVSKPEAASTGGEKPIPVGALNKVLEAQDALGATQVISDIISKHAQRIKDNSLPFGPLAAAQAKARTFANMGTEADANFNEWEADKTKIVNESLRLNKGVQTEGDAQRAVKELMGANDRATAARALRRLAELNNRAVQLQRQKMQTIYSNYGRSPNGESAQQPQRPAAGGGWKIEVVN